MTAVKLNDDDAKEAAEKAFRERWARLTDRTAVCLSIAREIGLSETAILTRFDRGWNDLEAGIAAAIEAAGSQPPAPNPDETTLLLEPHSP